MNSTNRYAWLFWPAIICVTIACGSLVSRAQQQQQHQVTITSAAPLAVEGDGKDFGGGLPPTPPIVTFCERPGNSEKPECELDDDRWMIDLLWRTYADGPKNVTGADRYHELASREMAWHCRSHPCPADTPDVIYDGVYATWQPWYYSRALATCRGSGRPCLWRRSVPVGNGFCVSQIFTGTPLEFSLVREWRDAFPAEFTARETRSRCGGRLTAGMFEASAAGEPTADPPLDSAFGRWSPLAVTSEAGR
jgi:hypothetical protein